MFSLKNIAVASHDHDVVHQSVISYNKKQISSLDNLCHLTTWVACLSVLEETTTRNFEKLDYS